jgi:serine/threonine-protein kinase
VKQHGGDPEASLAAVSSLGSVRDDLGRLDDTDLQASLVAAASRSAGPGKEEATANDTPSSRRAGGRFRILRFHREGGLGRVYVARDEELGREVALKEIHPDKADAADLRGRFVLEAEINGGLEHPGIVPVYSLGTYEDGRPFYAMRFVEGDSLKEAIEAYHKEHPQPDPDAIEFRKLLGRFVDVCEAIAFAHSKGVLHRDLKPHNVMLGRYGETLLIDWGLAKATGRREPAGPDAAGKATLVPPSGSGHAPTIGVLGSPPYMSPEQAAGAVDSLGPATDVYGLGAILFALLTGEPPAEGKTTGEILDRVRRGDIRTPRSLNPHIPRALEEICLKAISANPGKRYSAAIALAEDVERWLAGEPVAAWIEPFSTRVRRWGRRHRTLVTTTAVGVVMMLVGTAIVLAEQTRARFELKAKNDQLIVANEEITKANANLLAASERERARFNLAIDAVKLFHGEVTQDLLLKQKQFEGLRTKLIQGAAEFYGKLEEMLRDQTDPSSRASLGQCYYELGELTNAIGSKPAALAVHRKALAVRRALANDLGPDAGTQTEFARSLIAVGTLHWAIGETVQAMSSYKEAVDLIEGIAGTLKSADPTRAVQAMAYQQMGRLLLESSHPTEALTSYERALAIQQALASADPRVVQFQRDVASIYVSIGTLFANIGKPKEALTAFESAQKLQQELPGSDPKDTQALNDLARSLDFTATRVRYTGGDALPVYLRAREIWQKLMHDNPNIIQFQSNLANTDMYIGMTLQRSGRLTDALQAHQRAIEVYQRLERIDATSAEFRWKHAQTLGFVAGIRTEARQRSEAVAAWREAITLYGRVATPTHFDLYNLACSHAGLSGLAAEPGSEMTPDEGRAEAERAMECLARAVAAGYRNLEWMRLDGDLNALRPRADFQLLMMDVAFPDDPFAR